MTTSRCTNSNDCTVIKRVDIDCLRYVSHYQYSGEEDNWHKVTFVVSLLIVILVIVMVIRKHTLL